MSLGSLDSKGHNLSTTISVKRVGEKIGMHIPVKGYKMPSKLLWNVIIQAYGCEVHREETELSKM